MLALSNWLQAVASTETFNATLLVLSRDRRPPRCTSGLLGILEDLGVWICALARTTCALCGLALLRMLVHCEPARRSPLGRLVRMFASADSCCVVLPLGHVASLSPGPHQGGSSGPQGKHRSNPCHSRPHPRQCASLPTRLMLWLLVLLQGPALVWATPPDVVSTADSVQRNVAFVPEALPRTAMEDTPQDGPLW